MNQNPSYIPLYIPKDVDNIFTTEKKTLKRLIII